MIIFVKDKNIQTRIQRDIPANAESCDRVRFIGSTKTITASQPIDESIDNGDHVGQFLFTYLDQDHT